MGGRDFTAIPDGEPPRADDSLSKSLGILRVAALLFALTTAAAHAADVEPSLRLPAADGRAVALTLDACSGGVDLRILDALVADRVPATIFVTHRWLRRNAAAIALLKAHADLFEIENHGDAHLPAVTDQPLVYGLKTAGSLKAIADEVNGGADAVRESFGRTPTWYRDATARYSRDALPLIAALGFRIAGYSLNADVGASLPAAVVARRIAAARPGDVIIAHVNQPNRPSGQGVADGVARLVASGFRFVRLDAMPAAPGLRPAS